MKSVIDPSTVRLFVLAKRWMPRLPCQDIDLLIVDRLGKNISGAGMDPNVIGRGVHGYSSLLGDRSLTPVIRRLFVRDLTPESHGNAIGVVFRHGHGCNPACVLRFHHLDNRIRRADQAGMPARIGSSAILVPWWTIATCAPVFSRSSPMLATK